MKEEGILGGEVKTKQRGHVCDPQSMNPTIPEKDFVENRLCKGVGEAVGTKLRASKEGNT